MPAKTYGFNSRVRTCEYAGISSNMFNMPRLLTVWETRDAEATSLSINPFVGWRALRAAVQRSPRHRLVRENVGLRPLSRLIPKSHDDPVMNQWISMVLQVIPCNYISLV